jgi:hypothetical protein
MQVRGELIEVEYMSDGVEPEQSGRTARPAAPYCPREHYHGRARIAYGPGGARLLVERAGEFLPWQWNRPQLGHCRRTPRSAGLQRCNHVVPLQQPVQ